MSPKYTFISFLICFCSFSHASDLVIFEHAFEYKALQNICTGLHMGSGRPISEIAGKAFTDCPIKLGAVTKDGQIAELCLVMWRSDKSSLVRDLSIQKCAQLPVSHMTDQGTEELAAYLRDNGVPVTPEQADDLGWRKTSLPGI
jgi:hypothetical protein